ncbi:MAG: ABC transporter ATP-binding protein [Chloroflexaceae bacterium]|nr:ABC transporter ATP-binding protein [Chloroflexaceae bacterium]
MKRAIHMLLPFLRPYWPQILLVFLSILVVTGAGLLGPWLIRSLVQTVRLATDDHSLAAWGVGQLALALLVVYLLRSTGQFLTFHISHVVAFNVCHDLQVTVYRYLQRFSPAFYANRQTGEIVSRVVKDTEDVEPVIADAVYDFLVSLLLAGGIIVILLQLNPGLTLLALLPVPFAFVAVLVIGRPMTEAFRREGEYSGEMSALVQDNVSGIREIQIFNRERQELARVRDMSHRYTRQSIRARKLTAMLFPAIEGASGISTVLVIWFGGQQALQGTLAVEDLVAFVLYLATFYQPLWTLLDVVESLQRGIASVNRIGDVLQLQPDIADPPNGLNPGRMRGAVVLENVTFGYYVGQPVLHNITMQVAPGQTLALVGPTGAGKSTVASLIARFYDPQQGQVLIDGHDVRNYKLDALRRNVSMVLQDVFLFNGSVRDNIRFGKPDATDEELVAAARAANAHDFILALPEGYNTAIGERGIKLSGGQKQRLSIARALLKNAPILILDEATSAVDSTTEAQIQQAFERLRAGRTCIVIAHRLSTVRSADQIVVLDHGRVVERGTHAEVVASNGLYATLVAQQR